MLQFRSTDRSRAELAARLLKLVGVNAVVNALTGKEPRIRRMKDGEIMIVCGRDHLDGFTSYAELAEAIEKWLEETRGR